MVLAAHQAPYVPPLETLTRSAS